MNMSHELTYKQKEFRLTVVAMRRSWVVAAAAAPASAFLLSPASAFLLSPGAARQRGCAPSPFSCRAWKAAESDTPGVLYSTARTVQQMQQQGVRMGRLNTSLHGAHAAAG
jgi:hypothetical protein